MNANVDIAMLDLDLMILGSLFVIARQPHAAIALDERDPTARLCQRHAYGVLHRAPFAREVRDGDAARPALVHAPHAIARLKHRKQRRVHQPPFTRSSFLTALTPLTRLATSSARRLVSSESTLPFSVTMPLSLSTLMLRSVFKPTLFMSAVCTLVVSVASLTNSLFFCRPSSVAWSFVLSCAQAGAAPASPAIINSAMGFMVGSLARSVNCRPTAPVRGSRRACRSAGGGFPARGSAARA